MEAPVEQRCRHLTDIDHVHPTLGQPLHQRIAEGLPTRPIVPTDRALAQGVDVAIIDGLRAEWHPTHLTVDEACDVAQAIGARQSYLTHMTFQVDYATYSRKLASTHPRVALAHDGLKLRLGESA